VADQATVYRVTFLALPDDVPPSIRLRRLLKIALRALALKCTEAEEIRPSEGDTGPAGRRIKTKDAC
jgi:hypothetical protein